MNITIIQRTRKGLNTSEQRLTVGKGNEGDKRSVIAMLKKEQLESSRAYSIDRSNEQRNNRRAKR
jgi:hypothetical protein